MGLRAEAWTVPWDSAGFHRKIPKLPISDLDGNLRFLSTGGTGSCTLNLGGDDETAPFDKLDLLMSDTEPSLIRIYDDATVIHEWLPQKLSRNHDEANKAVVTGRNLDSKFDEYLTFPYDYGIVPGGSTIQDNWVWGGDVDGGGLLTNGGFEVVPFPNGGFEDGVADPWQVTSRDGFLTNAATVAPVLDAGSAQAGSYYGLVNPGVNPESGCRRSLTGLVPGESYTIAGYIREDTASGDRFRAGVSGASTATHTNAYEEDGFWWAEIDQVAQGAGASDGTWQPTAITFVASSDQAELVIIYSDPGAGPDFWIDSWTLTGGIGLAEGVGLDPWVARYPNRTNSFVHNTTTVHSGSGAVCVQADDQMYTNVDGRQWFGRAGIHQPVGLVVGRTYTATVWVQHSAGSNQEFRLAISRVGSLGVPGSVGSNATAATNVSVASATWTQLQVTFVADWVDIRFYVTWVYDGAFDTSLHASPTYYVDDASLVEGLPATSGGDIVNLLIDSRGALFDWIDTSSFDDVNDSNTVAWVNGALSFTAPAWSHFGHTFDTMVDLGLEWELRPKTDSDEYAAGTETHNLNFYNSGGRDDAPDIGLGPKGSLQGGESVLRIPAFTSVVAEGAGGVFVEDEDATLLADFGASERHVLDSKLGDLISLGLLADSYLAYEVANRNAVQMAIIDNGLLQQPLVDYRPGDTVAMQLPPGLAQEDRRIQSIEYTYGEPTSYVVTGSRILQGEAAAYDLIWRMWRRFNRPREEPAVVGGGGEGGMLTIAIAAHDASEQSLGKADLFTSGTIAGAIINQAISILTSPGGTIWLSEGSFSTTEKITVPYGVTLRGLGHKTIITTNVGNDTWGIDVLDGGEFLDADGIATTGSFARIYQEGG